MKTYTIQSGQMNEKVKAKTPELAAMKAIKKSNPKALGLIISCMEDGADEYDECYLLTTRVLKKMGHEVEED